MLILSCKNLGDTQCTYEAQGITEQEVMDKMMVHIREAHSHIMSSASEEQLREMMQMRMREA